jgi:ammonium transporter Rh
MLIGFGFIMAFSKSFSWSVIGFTFFISAITPQLYVLLSAFWKRVLVEGFHGHNYYIYVNESTFTLGLYCAASMLVSIGCTIGRVGPLEVVILSLVHSVVYTLNEVICVDLIGGFDVGGSTIVHVFGTYAGLATSLILSRISKPTKKA